MADLYSWQQSQWEQIQQASSGQRMPHAVLLTGPEGIGKLEFSRFLANKLICQSIDSSGYACGVCGDCHLFAAGNHPDVTLLAPEEPGKQIKIDVIRELIANSIMAVASERYRVFIISPADAMGNAATNALLKTLEEPVSGTLLILISAYPDRLPATIKSRCQILRFSAPTPMMAKQWLEEKIPEASKEIEPLLQMADGAPLSALRIHREGGFPEYQTIMKEFLSLPYSKQNPVQLAEKWLKSTEGALILDYLVRWVQDILCYRNGAQYLRSISKDQANSLKNQRNQLDLRTLYGVLDLLYESKRRLVNNLNMQLILERVLLHWVQITKNGVR